MSGKKALSLIAVAAIATSWPVFARHHTVKHARAYHWQQQNLIPRYVRSELPHYQQSRGEFRDLDPTRIGGEDPSRHPTAW